MLETDFLVYVAADPKQPGAAWGACVDDPKYTKETAKTVAGYIKRGATVMRVDRATSADMLTKWVRPEKASASKDPQHSLL